MRPRADIAELRSATARRRDKGEGTLAYCIVDRRSGEAPPEPAGEHLRVLCAERERTAALVIAEAASMVRPNHLGTQLGQRRNGLKSLGFSSIRPPQRPGTQRGTHPEKLDDGAIFRATICLPNTWSARRWNDSRHRPVGAIGTRCRTSRTRLSTRRLTRTRPFGGTWTSPSTLPSSRDVRSSSPHLIGWATRSRVR